MFGFQSVISLTLLILGASAIVIDPLRQRDGLATLDRRQTDDHSGNAMWFTISSGTKTACGSTISSSDKVAVVAAATFDNSVCNKTITITAPGHSLTVTVADLCNASDCQGDNLRVPLPAFEQLIDDPSRPPSTIAATWRFV